MRTIPRRTFAQAGLTAPLLAGVAAATRSANAAPRGEEALNLAPSAPSVSVPSFGTTVRSDGTPIAVVISGGAGGMLNVVDLSAHTCTSRPFTDVNIDVQPWGFVTLSDAAKSVLIAAGRHLFRYDPNAGADKAVTRLSSPDTPGYSKVEPYMDHLWDVTVDENNKAYIAVQSSKHKGTILTYSATEGWGVLPGCAPVDAAFSDVRCLAYEGGKLYASVGKPGVYQIDVRTGAKTALTLPGQIGSGMIHSLEAQAGVLYVWHPNESGVTAIRVSTGGSLRLERAISKVVKRPGEKSRVYFLQAGANGNPTQLVEFNPADDTYTPVFAHGAGLTRLSRNSWADRETFVAGAMQEANLGIYNAGENQSRLYRDLIKPGPRTFQSLIAGGNGKLYASWYMTAPHLLAITPASDAKATGYQPFDAPNGQAEGMAIHGDRLITGLYESGTIAQHSLSTLRTSGVTPAIGLGQNRPYAIVHTTGEQFAVGSVPASGLGGALSLYDAATETIIWSKRLGDLPGAEGLLTQQSPISLAHRDGKLYIGTTIRGAHGTIASGQEAHLLEFDLNTRRVVRVVAPFKGKGQAAVTALVFGGDGQLYGITGQYVFRVNRSNLSVTAHSISQGGAAAHNRSWLVHRGANLYAVIGGRLYAVPTADFTKTTLLVDRKPGTDAPIPVSHLVVGADGYLYYTCGAMLYRHDHGK